MKIKERIGRFLAKRMWGIEERWEETVHMIDSIGKREIIRTMRRDGYKI